MPTYEYRCPRGHVSELVQSMHDPIPAVVECAHGLGRDERCVEHAGRVYTAPAAIHFHGGGFYETDYRRKYDAKRRPNAGDDLPIPVEAGITRAEGAEYDPPKRVPGDVVQRAPA